MSQVNEVMAPDLFGGETPMRSFSRVTPKVQIGYVKAYDDRNCGNCKNSWVKNFHYKYYRKCEILGCTNGKATDVSKNYVCSKHEVKTNELHDVCKTI